MQSRAIFEAALAVTAEGGEPVAPEIMIPLVATKRELEILRALVDQVAGKFLPRLAVRSIISLAP